MAVLSDALFFTRAIPIAGEAEKPPTPAEVASQVELALEGAAPFPLPQLYYGFYWTAGADRALVFAAYRRRFTTEQTSGWAEAELALPAFATVLGLAAAPATTIVLSAPEGLTAVHWDHGPIPASVRFEPLAPEATDEDRARVREQLLRRVESTVVLDLPAAPAAEPGSSDREVVFHAGDFVARLPSEVARNLDVRDKAELAARRRAGKRDLLLWRVGVGCVAAMLALVLGEAALFGAGFWQKSRILLLKSRAPVVERIMAAQEVANRIDDLSTKRLLPFEMIRILSSKKPPLTQFLRATTSGLYTLSVDAQTPNAGEIGVFKNDLDALPSCASVVIKNPQTRGQNATFTVVVTFKPEALKPAAPAS